MVRMDSLSLSLSLSLSERLRKNEDKPFMCIREMFQILFILCDPPG